MFLISGAEEEEERIPLSCSTVCFLRYFTIFIITAFESRGDCFAARPPPSPGSRLLQVCDFSYAFVRSTLVRSHVDLSSIFEIDDHLLSKAIIMLICRCDVLLKPEKCIIFKIRSLIYIV